MGRMTHDDLQDWLNRYVVAWRANERGPIEQLFTEDAVYRYRPYGGETHTSTGREAIVSGWLEDTDAPDAWEAEYRPFAVDGDRAVATGWSRYVANDTEPERTYHNLFLMRFAPDGRCAEFTELYMLEEDR
jgi:ketosteroid isomerase-like protein